jgi:hypothetical protein
VLIGRKSQPCVYDPVLNSLMRNTAALARDVLRRCLAGLVVLVTALAILPAVTTSQLHVHPVAAGTVRGIYRFSSTAWSTIGQLGFNYVTDGGTNTNYYQGQRAAGLTGMVWLSAYDNSSCQQTMSDAEITQVVQTNVSGGNGGARYQVGDEPTANGCAARAAYVHMTSVIHAADRSAKTWVADDQFNDPSTSHWPAGLPMAGSVDILAFDIYPCQSGACQLSMIDLAIQRIHSVGLTNWEFILQDFGPCESWRATSAQEVLQQFQHWQGAGAHGYWVYTYDSDSSCPGNVAGTTVLKQINALAVNPGSAPPPPASPTSKPTSSPGQGTPAPKSSPRASSAPTQPGKSSPGSTNASPGSSAGSPAAGLLKTALTAIESSTVPLSVIAIGVLLAAIALGMGYLRRRPK